MSVARFFLLAFVFLTIDAFAQDSRPNVLLLTIDTLRADYLGANGTAVVRTPNLDRLAAAGVNFTRARSSVPLTLPSHASIFTGKFPTAHGVRDNGTFRLAENEWTLAEVLEREGYTTAAFVGAFVLDHRFGLAQGFDRYEDRTWSDVTMLENMEAERSAGAVYAAFSNWLASYQAERPFFVWIHLYDPHAPYHPPEPYASRYADNPYAGEVAYTDEIVGQIVSALENRELLSRTMLALVADHGEGLGEHDETTHSLLIYNSTLHVPMVLHAPGIIPSGRRIPDLVRTIDLAPTLLDYLEIPAQLGEGMSLRATIEGTRANDDIVAYAESLYPKLNLGWSELRAIETQKYRFILAPRPELYDVEEDPGESLNRVEDHPEIARRLRQRLEEMAEATSAEPSALDPQTQAKLRSLGYLSTSGARVGKGAGPPADPKTRMETWNSIQLAIFHFGNREYERAVRTFREILESGEEIPLVYGYLGSSYLRLGEHARAEAVYRRAIERGLESSEFHLNLGVIHIHDGDLEAARKELEIALALDPLSVEAHYRLGDVLRADHETERAIEQYLAALEINPSYVYARNALGMSYATLGRNAEALEAFRESVRANPRGGEALFNLAVQLERMERNQEAIDAYQEFLNLSTENDFSRQRQHAREALRRLQP